MGDALVVLNSGSSSIKFSTFALDGEDLELTHHGRAEGIYTAPRFLAADAGSPLTEVFAWEQDSRPGHDGALAYLVSHLRSRLDGYRLRAVGHRVVHGGVDFVAPVRVDADVISRLDDRVAAQ